MSCDCQCCTASPPVRCARELVLDAKDAVLAERVSRFVGNGTGVRSSSRPVTYAGRAQEPEPTTRLKCRCGRLVDVLAFVAEVLKQHHFHIDCEVCR